MSRSLVAPLLLLTLVALSASTLALAPTARAFEAGVQWRLAQPAPPPAPPGVEQPQTAVGLGHIGEISFYAPNRGALITAGDPPTVPPGVWEYNGVEWHEISEVCGATDGRIVWAGPEEFWTVSDGRPGQALVEGKRPPLEDDTLCRFSNPKHEGEPLQAMESFAFPAFQADSYQPMHAAGCFSPSDCWFGGGPLPAEALDAGTFELHWNGHELIEAPLRGEGRTIEGMAAFEGRLFEGARIATGDREEPENPRPPALHAVGPEPSSFVGFEALPLYEGGEFPQALDFLHLTPSAEFLWAGAGVQKTPTGSLPGRITILRGTNLAEGEGSWTQVVGPLAPLNSEPFPGQTLTALAAEPGSESAWIGLDTLEDSERPSGTAAAKVARVSAQPGEGIEARETLPGARGATSFLTCPAAQDCWLATTSGWLYHLSSEQEETLEPDPDPAFETFITERPLDQGLPQTPPDTLPSDDSGLPEGPPEGESSKAETEPVEEARRTLPLLTHVHSHLHGTVLELRFHLTVKARVRLLAKRAKKVVARTPMRTLKAGNRCLSLRLNVRRWPTKLALETHPLAPLPTVAGAGGGGGENVVSTSLEFPAVRAADEFGQLP
ncbi:MAG TPA: hypothetical protein VGG08_05715 [Solirubrobacteraceae bacterium]|jgi:hypothetical protein